MGGLLQTRSQVVEVGAGSYSLRSGVAPKVDVRLNAKGRNALEADRHHWLVVSVRATVEGGTTRIVRVRLT